MKKPDMETIRSRRDLAVQAMQPHHERALDDMRFVIGDHYPQDVREEREAAGQPCLTINMFPQYVRNVTGQIRSLNPSIRVAAGDNEASKDTAKVIEGLIRHIENRSDASSVYEAAAESAAACSLGFWRIRTEYADENTFDQDILIERIFNPFSVFLDPSAKEPTRCDAKWGFICEDVPLADFKEQYPKAETQDFTSEHRADWVVNWFGGEKVTVAEYFWIEHVESEIGLTADGRVIEKPIVPQNFVKTRKVKRPKVMWAKVTGAEVLEGPTEFPSRYIPIVAVTGEEWHIGEENYISSVGRHAKDSAMLYNYSASTAAEVTALQPKSPYLLTNKQVAGHEDHWAQANTANKPYLTYTPDPAAPPPMRLPAPMSSEGLITQMQIAAEDMKRTTGIYDAGLGARSNETSGKAILARKSESQNATSIYADNMVKSVMHTGKIILDMIPRVYDTMRMVIIIGEDGSEKMETINAIVQSAEGVRAVNDLTVGKYDVRIQVGPSYQTKREESQAGMMEFMRVVPQAATVAADIFAGMQDWPDSDRIQKRLQKALPPGLYQPEPEEMTPEEQQAMQAAGDQAQQQQAMQQMAADLARREGEAKIAKLEAEAARAEAEALKTQAEAQKASFELATLNGTLADLVRDAVANAPARAAGIPQL